MISQKHGGTTSAENLAYACAFCNRCKGTDIASLSPTTGNLSRLFHPRTDRWSDHFALDADARIRSRTEIGEVTVKILAMNDEDRLIERITLQDVGRYPTAAARTHIAPP